MARKRYSPEVIIRKMREAEVLQGEGKTIAEIVKQLCITEQTFYGWRKEYGGMRTADPRWPPFPIKTQRYPQLLDNPRHPR